MPQKMKVKEAYVGASEKAKENWAKGIVAYLLGIDRDEVTNEDLERYPGVLKSVDKWWNELISAFESGRWFSAYYDWATGEAKPKRRRKAKKLLVRVEVETPSREITVSPPRRSMIRERTPAIYSRPI